MGERIGQAAERRETVLLATGHPSGLLPVYLAVARELAQRGCAVLTPAAGWSYEVETPQGRGRARFAISSVWRCSPAAERCTIHTTPTRCERYWKNSP